MHARGEMDCGCKLEVPVDFLVEFLSQVTCFFSISGGSSGSALPGRCRAKDLCFKFDFL